MLGAQTNFLVFLAAIVAIAALGWLFRGPLLRVKSYFLAWAQADKRAEEQAKKETAQRAQAESELRDKLVEDEPGETVQRVQR